MTAQQKKSIYCKKWSPVRMVHCLSEMQMLITTSMIPQTKLSKETRKGFFRDTWLFRGKNEETLRGNSKCM